MLKHKERNIYLMSSKSVFKYIFALGLLFFIYACSKDEYYTDYKTKEKQILETNDNNKDDGNSSITLFQSKYIIAHMGVHGNGVPENSRESLIKALELNIYGTEFDVRQTKDKMLVICHNASFHGLSIANSSYEELSQYALKNGESFPLLEDFLKIKKDNKSNVRLIIELKGCNVSDLVQLVDKYDLQDEVDYISFSSRYCNELVSLGYGDKTYFLGGNYSPAKVKDLKYGGIDYRYIVYNSNENWIDEAKALNLKTVVWVVNDVEKIKEYIQKEVIVTTDYPQKGYEIEEAICKTNNQ